MNLNKAMLAGNLTRDPELRYTPNGKAVVNITVATNRQYQDAQGNRKEEKTFVRCVFWGKQAEALAEHFAKGKPIFVEGRLRLNEWEDSNGNKRSTLEVHGDSWQFVGPKGGGGNRDQQQDEPPPYNDDTPF